MAENEHKHALYLAKDNEVKLFHKDDLEDAFKDGWELPSTPKSTGEPWNPETPDDEVNINDAQAEVLRANAKRQDKLNAEEAKQAEADQRAAEKAQAAAVKQSKPKE